MAYISSHQSGPTRGKYAAIVYEKQITVRLGVRSVAS
jgi:hypothetical protein